MVIPETPEKGYLGSQVHQCLPESMRPCDAGKGRDPFPPQGAGVFYLSWFGKMTSQGVCSLMNRGLSGYISLQKMFPGARSPPP